MVQETAIIDPKRRALDLAGLDTPESFGLGSLCGFATRIIVATAQRVGHVLDYFHGRNLYVPNLDAGLAAEGYQI